MIYFDNAATTLQKPPCVMKAVKRAMRRCGGAGRGSHSSAGYSAGILYRCREAAAELFGLTEPERVVFTMNATHALNIAIRSIAERLQQESPKKKRVLISGYEHNAVFRPMMALKDRSIETVPIHAPPFEPEVFLHKLELELDAGAGAVVCTHVSNVFGYILPIDRVDRLCVEYGIPLVLDASQSAGCLPLAVREMKAAEFIAMPGHKGLLGPQGTGILICRGQTEPVLWGGTGSDSRQIGMPDYLPERLEAGTQNAPGLAGLCEGIRFVAAKGTDAILEHERSIIRQILRGLDLCPTLKLYTCPNLFCQTGVLSIGMLRHSCEAVAEALSQKNIAVRAGLHCAPLAHKSAGTLETGTLRVSASYFNTNAEANRFCEALLQIISTNR